MLKKIKLIGVDLGGTKVNVGLVEGDHILERQYAMLPKHTTSEWDVITTIIDLIKTLPGYKEAQGIGVGVPSILDREKGIVHEVQNIPFWTAVPLRDILSKEFDLPVYLDNDANCFALGEYHFGIGQGCKNLVGLTLGTGMGSGIISNGHLLSDANCGAGEFGMIPYENGIIEDYCSGKFFKNNYNSNGEELMKLAVKGDEKALEAFQQFGRHLGNAIKTIMYSVDPNKVIIGGSVVQSLPFFQEGLNRSVQEFAYSKVLEKFEVLYSNTPNIAIIGAASLYYDRADTKH